MLLLNKKSIFSFLIIFFGDYVLSIKDVKIWENIPEPPKDYSYLSIDSIDSIAYDNFSNTELILGNSNSDSFFFVNENGRITKIKNTLNIVNIESPLMKFEFNSEVFYYFCSSSYPKLLLININKLELEVIENEDDVNDKNPQRIKCFKSQNEIAVIYLEIHSFYIFNPENKKYKSCTLFSGNFKFKAVNAININNSYSTFITIITNQKETYYNVTIMKYENSNFVLVEMKYFEKDAFTFYSNIEIAHLRDQQIAIITYETSDKNEKNNNKFIFYQVSYPLSLVRYNGGSTFLRFLNESQIKSIGFIDGTSLMYYSIKNFDYNDSYIGVADLTNLIVIYNIKENSKGKLFTNYGYLNSNKLYLNYFNDNILIRFCPFIKTDDDSCTYYVKNNNEDSDYFSIGKNENKLNKNSKSLKCENGKIINKFYCLEKCPIGYSINDKECNNCFTNIDQVNNYYYSYKERNCQSNCSHYLEDNVCFDCKENELIFEDECISSCDEIYGIKGNNSICIICKDINKYYYKNNNKEGNGECIGECSGEINYETYECIKCEEKNLILFQKKCISECPDYYIHNKISNQCDLCQDNYIYENYNNEPKCVDKCTNKEFGINSIYLDNEKKYIKICSKCEYFNQDGICVVTCGERYYEDNTNCKKCPENKYFVENKNKSCYNEKCPINTVYINNNTCKYCEENYNKDNLTCVKDCSVYGLGKIEEKDNVNYCIDCKSINKIYNKGECIDNNICENNTYINKNNICKKCLCVNNKCQKDKYECDCSGDKYSYGYNCEFYSKENIDKLDMYIISLNNKLIQTQKNYFTYNITKKKEFLERNYTFEWKLFFDEEEITNNKIYQKFFATGTNESVFGINKELFDFAIENNKNVNLSLSINNADNREESYFHNITLIIIKYDELSQNYFELTHKGKQKNYEMETLLNLNSQTNFEVSNMQYYFQYEFMDYYYERLPITPYTESEKINFYSPYLKNIYINVKNDRDEKLQIICPVGEMTSIFNASFEQIKNLVNYSETEKAYALISKLRENKDIFNTEEIKIIDEFIKNNLKTIINKNGYYIENYTNKVNNNDENVNNRSFITYSEPKLFFSLINYFLINQKNNLNKEIISNNFFNYFNITFEEIFKEENLSNKTLSDSDIKSIFRTLDNLYDAVILINDKEEDSRNKINNEKFIEILNNLCKYLSYLTYPSELVKLIGKRISLLSFHLGEHQTNISFPFISNMENIKLNNFSKYSYDNYYLNENICNNKNSTFFCLTEDHFINMKNELLSRNYSLNDISLNIYLLQDIMKKNEYSKNEIDEKGHTINDDNSDYIIEFQNYSFILKLYDKIKKTEIPINFKNISFDTEFYFRKNFTENNQEEDNSKGISDFIQNFYKEINLNITLYPNNSNITCVPKSFYGDKNKNFLCKTHFNYDENKVRCSCNISDEIIVIDDYIISNFLKDIQFPKNKFDFINSYSRIIMPIFILLLLLPSIFYLLIEIIKDSKYIDNNQQLINDSEDEKKVNYIKVKKYSNTNIFSFSFYIFLNKFPYFTIFNNYNLSYPKYIRHLVIYIGILIGFCLPLIPFYNIPFVEKQIFIDQRDIKFEDNYITDQGPDIYRLYFFCFGLIGLILSHIFIYIFNIILGYYQQEKNIWFKIKVICKDYIYYEIKSEVLLGAIWKKIKLRMNAFYFICGNYFLNRKKQYNKFNEYINNISRNITTIRTNKTIGPILPKDSIVSDYRDSNMSNDINLNINKINKKNQKSYEMKDKNQPLLDKDENDLLINNNAIKEKIFSINNKRRTNMGNSKKFTICNLDNFYLYNNKYDKFKRKINNFEKIRNKYIYKLKNNIDEMEYRESIKSNQIKLYISPQINYSYYSVESFNSLNNLSKLKKESSHIILKFVFISFLLHMIFIGLFILTIYMIKTLLDKFDKFIIKSWIIPLSIIITIINIVLYYLKILFGTILLFTCYNKRKKYCLLKFLFWVFVDKSMIHAYKIRNLITKYKKEFDYLSK